MFDAHNTVAPGPLNAPEGQRPPARFKAISFFAGCGGMDLGFIGGFDYRGEHYPALPFRIVGAYDDNELCEATYKKNLGDHFHRVDLARADVHELPYAHVLIGGFPCQEFSPCGPQRGIRNKRGQLYHAMVRYAAAKRPAVIVAENVIHLVRLRDGKDFRKITAAFRKVGYRSESWEMMAADHGVPQLRHRVFLVFVRNDLDGFPTRPAPIFAQARRSVEWAIGDLVQIKDESVPNQSQYFRAALAGTGHGQGDEKSVRDMPAYTVRANAKSRIQFHYSLNRRLTIRECARIQTFPDSFVFPHSATRNITQVGNAVPPILAHEVAESVSEFLSLHYPGP